MFQIYVCVCVVHGENRLLNKRYVSLGHEEVITSNFLMHMNFNGNAGVGINSKGEKQDNC